MTKHPKTAREIRPKTWGVLGTVAATGLVALAQADNQSFDNSPHRYAFAAYAGEAGEAGEGQIDTEDAEVEFLVHLGFFEASYLIVSTLYADGKIAEAQEQLETSHHADYDDIAEKLDAFKLPGFEDSAQAFADAVMSGASPEDVATQAKTVTQAITELRAQIDKDPKDLFEAIQHLVTTAAADFEAGVDGDQVVEPHEYRDAWGFAKVAQLWAEAATTSSNETVAEAAKDTVERLEPAWALLPSVTAAQVKGKPSVLYGAAGWIEIAALKVK